MATTTSTTYASYTNISDIKSYWIENIAPNYFDFNNYNNYNVGIFGYVNEIMGNTVEDSFNAIAISRRECYPVLAQYMSSLYAMATLQSIEIPLTSPAVCKCALIIPQDEIINNSTYSDGVYECVIDNCLKIFAGDLQFMLDYPIIIISNKTDKWYHTIHYDISVSNSLNTTTSTRYISNKVIKDSGVNYVILFIDAIRQLEMEEISNVVIKDNVMDTITMDIDFDGNLANFEVFYKENSNSEEVQLTKVMINASTPKTKYVQYEMVNSNKIRLTFAYNTYFVPKFNSEIICRVYTSEGEDGNFNSFSEDLVCSSNSEKYPYNSNMTILGKVNGSASGGSDQLITEEFRNEVLQAYATNNTITTSNDLQIYWDDIADDITNVSMLFKKIRDDPLIRLYGAYCLVKDEAENVIPTNTLDMEFNKSDFVDDLTESITRIEIPAGTVFQYKSSDSYTIVPAYKDDGSIKTVLDVDAEDTAFYFTNPFLIAINLTPNNVGYYMASLDEYFPIEYTYINDSSEQQFIGGTLSVYRNNVGGSNYYKFQILLTPASEIDSESIVTINDSEDTANQIRAKYNGRVTKEEFYFVENYGSYIRYTVEYDTDNEDEKYEYIQASNTLPIGQESITGYEMQYTVGDEFIADDIIAVKRVTDLGNLLIISDMNNTLYSNEYYVPFSIQGYDEETGGYIMEAYIATNDEIDLSEQIVITHGIYTKDGGEDDNIALKMGNVEIEMNVLYNNDGNNISNKYTDYYGLNNYTLTNTYINDEDEVLDLIGTLPYIRSTVNFLPCEDENADENDYMIRILESPVLSASWASVTEQYNYFVSKYTDINAKLETAYYALENNFSIDSKFYNTYGKARFFTVGNTVDSMVTLDNVRCKFYFGISLNTIASTSTEQFISNFRAYVKEYVESDDKVTKDSGQNLYILNMIADIVANFEEIAYLEYHGFNSYDHTAQRVVGPDLSEYQEEFIPEFLNLDILLDENGESYPNITVDIY